MKADRWYRYNQLSGCFNTKKGGNAGLTSRP